MTPFSPSSSHLFFPLYRLLLLLLLHLTTPSSAASGTISATPHDSYSSSIGVLGCKINTDRVAYWPSAVSCDNLCVSLTHPPSGRQVFLLKVDQSGGAWDVSYDAWNYLVTGKGAAEAPTAGGGVSMRWEDVGMEKCAGLIKAKGKLPLSAANSMGFVADCLGHKKSWVADHYELWNIADPLCRWGHDEVCKLDYPAKNLADCGHTLGDQTELKGDDVYNIRYPTGQKVKAGTGEVVGGENGAASGRRMGLWDWRMMMMTMAVVVVVLVGGVTVV